MNSLAQESGSPSFSFGKNWQDYLNGVTSVHLEDAERDIDYWIGTQALRGKSVIDIGSGSGIHSSRFIKMGAARVVSLDADVHSVEATRRMWRNLGEPINWTVMHGSILDRQFTEDLGTFDIVYSWGVLHHTGAMWEAIENACSMVAKGGLFWISLYAKGPRYPKDLELKRTYNAASSLRKWSMLWTRILIIMLARLRHLENPLGWNRRRSRGMDTRHDLIDWLGGLPYEVASEDEVVVFCRRHGLVLERIRVKEEGGCSIYVFSRATAGTTASCAG
jgi:2-polyprenyl-6-hydroxyphenyl methylase/3-demethylubiquinone-9 3-methyltransferase